MNATIIGFQNSIRAAQNEFNSKPELKDEDILALKDTVFDEISTLSRSTADRDISQLLAQTAINLHLFPVRQEGWREELLEKISTSIANAFQVIAFITIGDETALAA